MYLRKGRYSLPLECCARHHPVAEPMSEVLIEKCASTLCAYFLLFASCLLLQSAAKLVQFIYMYRPQRSCSIALPLAICSCLLGFMLVVRHTFKC